MKKIKLGLLLVVLAVLMGCGNKEPGNDFLKEETKKEDISQVSEKGSFVNSIKDAMASGKRMRCVVRDNKESRDGGSYEVITVAYIDGEKFKNESFLVDSSKQNDFDLSYGYNHNVFDGENMFSWSEKTKKGVKISNSCSERLKKENPQSPLVDSVDQNKKDDLVEDGGVENIKCEEVDVIDFSVPRDVEFQDQCEMFNDVMKNIPGGVNIPKK